MAEIRYKILPNKAITILVPHSLSLSFSTLGFVTPSFFLPINFYNPRILLGFTNSHGHKISVTLSFFCQAQPKPS